MNHWLVKTEPGTYSWNDMERDGTTLWNGVRNFQARNHLCAMQSGDYVLFYHSVNEKRVVGIVEVVKEYYPDPTADDDRWVVVDLRILRKLKQPVTLAQIKADDRLSQMVLVKNSRLSVQPVRKEEFDIVLSLAENQS